MAPTGSRELSVAFRRQAGWLRVHVTGESTLENTIAYWQAIAAELQRQPVASILLVEELHGVPLTASQWFELVATMRGSGLERVRIAHVRPEGLHSVEFCEIFARDAGFEARVFDNEPAAEIWLKYGER
jgi:hypothetical protein